MLLAAATHIYRSCGGRVGGGESAARESCAFGAKQNNRRPVSELALEKFEMALEDFGLQKRFLAGMRKILFAAYA